MRASRLLLLLSGAVLAGALSGASAEIAPAAESKGSQDRARISEAFGRLPLYFVENRGQVDSRVAYYVQGRDTSVFFTSRGVTFALAGRATAGTSMKHPAGDQPASSARLASGEAFERPVARQRYALRLDFVGADPAARPTGGRPTRAMVSYFRGAPDQWKTGLRTYSSLVYRELWPGIDLVYSGTDKRLKYTFVLKPGADADRIRLAYRGGTAARINGAGQLEVSTPVGRFRDETPSSYQVINGRRVEVSTRFSLDEARHTTSARHEYGFRLGRYDRSKPLVIDPAFLVYAGYFGGAGDERGLGIAVDGLGNAYVTGQTTSTFDGGLDAYVVKVNAAGTALVYSGTIGGAGSDAGFDINLDAARNAYVTGFTTSSETTFPVIGGPDLTFNGREDTFVAKVNAAGTALVYSGYIGGIRTDFGEGIAVDSGGNAYVSGVTASNQESFPETVGPDLKFNGGEFDAFVAKVNAAGTGFVYAGYIGGARTDVPVFREPSDRGSRFVSGGHIAVDGSGNAYISGTTESNEHTFPDGNGLDGIPGPDKSYNGGADAFVAKVRSDGTGFAYAGYIGGVGDDRGYGMAVDSSGNAYLTGDTDSTEATFPVILGPDLTANGGIDAFVAKVKGDGTGLVYSGYIGGANDDQGLGVAIQEAASGTSLYVAGHTFSSEATFPVIDGPDVTFNGALDSFVAKLRPVPDNASARANFVYNGYIGGAGEEAAFWIDVDGAGNAYVVGDTESTQTTFPDGDGFGSVAGRDRTFNGGIDAFMAKVGEAPSPPNDNFASASPIASLPFLTSLSTLPATSQVGEPSPCGSIGKTVWYSFTPAADLSITANTFGSNYDTVLAAYTGTSLSNLTTVACNDQFGGNQSRVVFAATAGTTIFFQVGGSQGATGNLTFRVAVATPPPNDNFASASPIAALPFLTSLSTADATSETGEPSPCGGIGSTVWYSFTPAANGSVTANTLGSNYNTVLAAYTGTSLSNLTTVACNDQFGGNQSRIVLAATAGTTIFFQVGGSQGATGNLTFRVAVATPPPNDDFAQASPIASLPFTSSLSTADASSQVGEPSPCGGIGNTVWYSFTPGANVSISANTFGSNYDTVLAAYSGTSLSNLTTVACNDEFGGNGSQSRITIAATAGTTIFLQVGGASGATGNLTLNVALPPPNDSFASPSPIASLPFTNSLSTTGATSEVGEPSPCGSIRSTVWYSFTPASNMAITANTSGSGYDTVLAAYTGTSLSNLTAVACNDQFGGTNQSQISFAASAGTTVFFQVGGFFGVTGNLTFNAAVSLPPPANDSFANASSIASLPFTSSLSTVDATIEPGEPAACGLVAKSVWYSFTPGVNVTVTADTSGSNYDTTLAAYTGTSLSNLTAVACNDQSGGTIQSRLSIVVPAGTTIFFQAGSLFGASGNLTFDLTQTATTPPPNDRFASAAPIAALPFTAAGLSTVNATSEVGEPLACGGIAHTVWYSFTPAANVTITANTFGSNFDTVLAAYTGTSLSNLTAVACNDQAGGGNQSQVSFAATGGTTIFFQVGGFFGDTGGLTFNMAGS